MEKSIIEFLNKIEPLKSTLRHNWTKTGRQESSAEHSWRLAIFFMIANDLMKLNVDPLKTLKMIMIHDIAECVDGDIPGFIKERNEKTHQENELQQAERLFATLPEISNHYYELFKEYGEGATKEARVAKALDKIETQLQHLESGPKYWSKDEIGHHILTYPEKSLEKLGNKRISKIWALIKEKLEKIHEDLKISS